MTGDADWHVAFVHHVNDRINMSLKRHRCFADRARSFVRWLVHHGTVEHSKWVIDNDQSSAIIKSCFNTHLSDNFDNTA
jgi:hypothetical protein